MINKKFLFDKLKKDIHTKEPKNMLIISHINPDGDSIGSSLALFLYMSKFNHKIKILVPNKYPDFLKWMPSIDKIIIFSEEKNIKKKIYKKIDYIFVLDLNNLSRVNPVDVFLLENYNNSIKIMIDHHHFDKLSYNFDLIIHDSNESSTSILIYKFIKKMGDSNFIDKNISTCLYTGIVSDTGYFRYSNVNYNTHNIASFLIKKNINIDNINVNLYKIYNFNNLKLLGKILYKKTFFLKEYNTIYMVISKKDFFLFKNNKDYINNFVNYGLKIKKVILSAIFIEKNHNKTKISFRSIGKFNVNHIAIKYFNGGGHKNASGAIFDRNIKNTVNFFLKVLKKNKTYFNC